jgi:hypothetical protein
MDLCHRLWGGLTAVLRRAQVHLAARTRDAIDVIRDPLAEGVVCFADGDKWSVVQGASHDLRGGIRATVLRPEAAALTKGKGLICELSY